MPAGTPDPSVLAGLYSRYFSVPAETVMAKPSSSRKCVAPSAKVKLRPPAENAGPPAPPPRRERGAHGTDPDLDPVGALDDELPGRAGGLKPHVVNARARGGAGGYRPHDADASIAGVGG